MVKANLTEGSVLKKLIVFAVPFLISNVLQAVYSTVDLLIVSWYGSGADIAAVTVGSQVMTLITNVLVGFSIGITILTALYVGGGNIKKVGKLAGTSIVLFLALSIAATVALMLTTAPMVRLMNVAQESQSAAKQYLDVSYLGIIFIVLYNIIAGMYRGAGSTRAALIFIFISGVMNLILDIVFVKNLGMGAYGAAIATVVAQGAAFVMALALLIIQRKNFFLDFKSFKPDWQEFIKMVKLGLPTAVQQFTIQMSFMILMSLANSCGNDYNIAYGYVTKVSSFAILPLAAVMSAVSALAGQNLGAGKPERAVKSVSAGFFMMLPIALLIFALVNIFPKGIYGFFQIMAENKNPAIIEISTEFTRYMSWEYITVFTIYALHGFVNGAGKTTFTMFNSFLSSLIIRIPLAYLLFHLMGFNGLGLAIALSPIPSTIVAFIYVASGKWKTKSAAAPAAAPVTTVYSVAPEEQTEEITAEEKI